MRQILIQFLKFAVATGLIAWFVQSGKLDFAAFRQIARSPELIAALITLYALNVLINNLRWQLLLAGQKIQTSFRQTFPLTLIGMFFNLAIPGAVGGDVIKAIYIAQEHASSKARAVMSVGMDRVVGLFCFVILAVISGLANWPRMMEIPQLKALFMSVSLLFMAFVAFFAFCFSNYVRNHPAVRKAFEKLPGGPTIEKLYDAVHAYRQSKRQFALGMLLSVLAQSLFILSMHLVAQKVGQPQTWGALFFAAPLGLIVTAVPISPAGIGVGQVAFHQLFNWYNGGDSPIGATLITVMQLLLVLSGCAGAVCYFMRKAPASAGNARA